MATPPERLTLERNRELKGVYSAGILARRIGFALLAVVSVDVELRDGETHIATIERTVTVYP